MLRVISTVVATRAQPSVCQVLDRALGRLAWHTAAQETPGAWMRTMPPRVGTGGRWWGLPVAADLTAGISAGVQQPRELGTAPATAPQHRLPLPRRPRAVEHRPAPPQWPLSQGSQPLCLGHRPRRSLSKVTQVGPGRAALSSALQPQSHMLVTRRQVSVCTCSLVGTSCQGSEGTLALALWYTEETHTASKFPKIE